MILYIRNLQKKVIQTRSVEFMPFGLSFFLSLSAVMWFFYGLLSKDVYVAVSQLILSVLINYVLSIIYSYPLISVFVSS